MSRHCSAGPLLRARAAAVVAVGGTMVVTFARAQGGLGGAGERRPRRGKSSPRTAPPATPSADRRERLRGRAALPHVVRELPPSWRSRKALGEVASWSGTRASGRCRSSLPPPRTWATSSPTLQSVSRAAEPALSSSGPRSIACAPVRRKARIRRTSRRGRSRGPGRAARARGRGRRRRSPCPPRGRRAIACASASSTAGAAGVDRPSRWRARSRVVAGR